MSLISVGKLSTTNCPSAVVAENYKSAGSFGLVQPAGTGTAGGAGKTGRVLVVLMAFM